MRQILPTRLSKVAGLFLKLGITGYRGPAAYISMKHDEVVNRLKWLNDQEFIDLVGETNLIPGLNSTEMAIHLGLTFPVKSLLRLKKKTAFQCIHREIFHNELYLSERLD